MALPASISHLAHLGQKLWLQDTGKSFLCDGCREPGGGERYRCHPCDFDLHKHCALDKSMALPASISHPAHLGHRLSLEATEYWEFVCNGCRESGAGERYRCRVCRFDLHTQCALEEGTKIMAFPRSISHPDHWGHKLSLEATDYWKFVCNGCRKSGLGERYRCRACKFDLHKQCAWGQGTNIMASSGLISHSAHWEHMLTLCAPGLSNFVCNGCREPGTEERYRCHACDFDLHKQCALDQGTKLVHPLLKNVELELRFQGPKDGARLVCDACGNAVLGFHYHSSKLCLRLHPCCANPLYDKKKEDDGRGRDQPSRSKFQRTLSVSGHISDAIDTGEAIADLFNSINLDDGGSVEEPDFDFDF
ncbi:hypothetical protein CFC21_111690 [Triticum aestivum]|uniref:ZZ-type domain-containing protein n=2 Tax=Triticum aestivum TaxID=4565 RepID=A0A9R1MQJ6_WHEAT|nr:uncharacterized protein LOC123171446 [Triticum aestivum]KAF7111710.1 hypothetical protein CFC21_111690 [Triticum aestivum]